MKRFKVTLIGTLSYSAKREFLIECSEDMNPRLLDRNLLEELADESQIAWNISTSGFLFCSDHEIEASNDPDASTLAFIELPG